MSETGVMFLATAAGEVKTLKSEYIVKRWSFSGDATAMYEVWERASGPMGDHSSITTFQDATPRGYSWWGRVTSRWLDGTGYDALPAGPERSEAFDAYLEGRRALAYAAIRLAFPEHRGVEKDGEVIERDASLPPEMRAVLVG